LCRSFSLFKPTGHPVRSAGMAPPIGDKRALIGEEELTAPYPPPMPAQGQAPNNTFGLGSMILGIIAIPLACCAIPGLVLGIAAGVLGFLGKQKADQGLATNRGQAMTGLICGAVAAGLGLVIFIIGLMVNLPGVA
jgi:hypothetical protein